MTAFVTTLFAAVSTAAQGAAGVAGAASAAGSTLMTGLQVVSTGLAALGTLGAAAARADALRGEAADEKMRATQDFIAGQQQANEVRRRVIATVADQAVAFAANGVDLSSGVVADARAEANELAERQIGTASANANIKAAARRLRAERLYAQADQAETSGGIGALTTLAQGGVSILKRG